MKLLLLAVFLLYRSPPDGSLTSGLDKHELESDYLELYPCAQVFHCEDNVFHLTKAEEINTMSTGEDEASPRNGRLRPRKSISTCTPNPQLKAGQNAETKRANDRPKRSSTSSKASSVKHDDLSAKSDIASPHLFLCPYCDSTFHARQTASKHARRIHLSTTKQDNFIKCLYCNHTDADSDAIIKHMVDSHPNQYFACLDCHTRFPSTTELAEHKLTVCDKQKLPYRCKLRQKSSTRIRRNSKKLMKKENVGESNENAEYTEDITFNGIVISCELKPSESHDAADIEDKITTNLILPSAKTSLAKTGMDKSAVIVLDDLQWNKRIPPNFSFHNTDADQILSRLGVVHRSPRVGESKKDFVKLMDEPNEKFEKCFDTSFYSKVSKNVLENLANFVDGTLNFNPNKDSTSKTRKSKASVLINTAEGFPILLAPEQFSRHLFDGFVPRALAPKHKWKWDSTENDKSLMTLLDQTKRDSHVNNCIVTLISGLDIWTQLRMKSKFDEIFKTTPAAKKAEKQNKIATELKEILESRDIPRRLPPVVEIIKREVEDEAGLELAAYLGLSASRIECVLQPAVLSGEWVRPRCFVCCACGEQTRDARSLTAHLAAHHPNAQVQHHEIVGDTLLSADISKHLYVPLTQTSNRTRPSRGFRDCTKCNKSVTLEDLHQHMLECAGDTPAVRRKCRYRPFGVRRRRPRLPDNIIRKKMRKDLRARCRQKSHMRPRPRNRTDVGDAETIRKMIADLPAKRNRITPTNVLRPKRTILKVKKQVRVRVTEDKNQRARQCLRNASKVTAEKVKHNDTDNSSTIDEDDQPLKVSATRIATRSGNSKQPLRRTITINKNKKKKPNIKKENKMQWSSPNYDYSKPQVAPMGNFPNNYPDYYGIPMPLGTDMSSTPLQSEHYSTKYFYPTQLNANPERSNPGTLRKMRGRKIREEEGRFALTGRLHVAGRLDMPGRVNVTKRHDVTEKNDESETFYVTGIVHETERVDDSVEERIDVTSSCSSNVRQYSGVDDNNAQRSLGHPTDPREGSHQKNYVSQMPNLPLKHSIASLTSATEEPDTLTPYLRPYVLPSPINKSFAQGSLERKDFENEVTVEKVDKPPLSNNSAIELTKDSSHIPPFAYSAVGPRSLYDPIELQARGRQISLPSESTASDGSIPPDVRQQSILNEIQESNDTIEDLSISKDTTESETQKTDLKETSRIKTNKVRKVLNIENCIAKIRTKKGLPIDKTENPDSVSQNAEKTAAEVPVPSSSPKSELPLDATETKQNSVKAKNNGVTKQECIKKQLSKTHDMNPANDKASDENEVTSHAMKASLPDDDAEMTQTQRQSKPELSIIKSIKRPDSEIIKNSIPKQTSPAESCFETPGIINEFMLHLSVLSSFWRSHKIELSPQNTKTGVKKTLQLLMDLNIPSVTEVIPKMQEQMSGYDDKTCMELLYNYSISCLYQKFNRQLPDSNELYNDINKSHAYVASLYPLPTINPQLASQLLVAHHTENAIEENMPRQANDSPTSRRMRRKPNKKTSAISKKTQKQSKQMASVQLSPREMVMSQFDSNVPAVFNARNLKLALPDAQYLRTTSLPRPLPPNTRARRGSYRRISNSLDTGANVYETGEVLRTSPLNTTADKIHQQLINNLRRQSFEAYAQSEMANYNNLAIETYHMEKQKEYERLLKAQTEYERKSKYSEKPHHSLEILHNTSGSEHFRREERLYPLPTLPLVNLDVHENVPGASKAGCSNQVNKSKAQDRYGNLNTSYDCGNDHKSANLHSSEENKSISTGSFDVCACGTACHESQEATQLCNFNRLLQHSDTHILDSNPTRVLTRRSSEVYSRASVSNMDLLDKSKSRLNENTVNLENFSHGYLEPLPPFDPPSVTKLPVTRDPQPTNLDEDAPLDLSCVSRKEQIFENLQASDLSINMCMKDRQNDDTSIISRRNLENMQTHSQHNISMPEYAPRYESVDDLARDKNPTQLLHNADNYKNLDLCIEKHHEVMKRGSDANARPAGNDDNSFVVNSTNNSHEIDYKGKSSKKTYAMNVNNDWSNVNDYYPSGDNYAVTCELQETDKNASEDQDNLRVSEDISRPNNKLDDSIRYTATNLDVSKDYHLNLGQHLASQKAPVSNDPVQDQRPKETIAQQKLSENDTNQSDQDAETARKIAMLPEELVKVLGTIPKDHRNQLLNILPQYVSAPVTNVEADKKNMSPNTTYPNTNTTWPEHKENTMICNDPSRGINPCNPEKRHSPSQSRGSLNAGESQSTIPILDASFMPTLSSHAPFGKNDSCNPGPLTSNSFEKASADINTRLISNKFQDNISTITTSHAIPTELSTCKLPAKQKASNEQTASLRAVRIKTTLAKKTFYEDKKSLVNYTIKTNTEVDETSMIPNLVLPNNTSTSDLKQDDDKTNNKQISSGTHLRGEVTEDTSSVRVHNPMTNSNVTKESEYVCANEKPKVLLDKTQEIDCQVDLLSASNKCLSQITNSSVENRETQPEKSLIKPPVISAASEAKENMFESTPLKFPCDNHGQNNATDKMYERLESNKSQDNENSDSELLPSVSNEMDVKLQMDKNNEPIRATEDPNEEDSEDDIALAVIKQKNTSLLVMPSKGSAGKTKKTKQSKLTQKQNRQKKTSKRHKKMCSIKSSSPKTVPDSTSSLILEAIHNDDETERNTITKFVDTSDVNDLDSVTVKLCDTDAILEAKEKNTGIYPENIESANNNSLDLENLSVEEKFARKDEVIEENYNLTNVNILSNSNTIDDNNKHISEVINKKKENKNELTDFTITARNQMTDDTKPTSELQLCSEMSTVTIPLRRSRRGKSMYVDSSYIEDTDKIDDNAKATPLTMKRLILSRVEEDKKRISESNAVEAKSADMVVLIDESKIPADKKSKQAKRKKSPSSRKSSQKKSKPGNTFQIDDKKTDTGNRTTENNGFILQELHDAKTKISDNKSCKNDVNCPENATSTGSCFENNTLVSKEKESEISSETSDTSKSVKGKLNVSNLSDLNSAKSNITKYKNKSQSDFDSDDDKVLIETKQSSIIESVEKNELIDHDKSQYITQESTLRLNCTTSSIPVDTQKICYSKSSKKPRSSSVTVQDRTDIPERDPYNIEFDELLEPTEPIAKKKRKVSQTVTSDCKVSSETKQNLANESFETSSLIDQDVNKDNSKEQEITRETTHNLDDITHDIAATDTSISVEVRKTCYSRPVPSKKPRSSSATVKSSAGTSEQRDPYDFDDVLESAKPIPKKKSKANQVSKLIEQKATTMDDLNSSQSKASNQVPSKTVADVGKESDSDSSKSDVPLQKYVEEKQLELKSKFDISRVGNFDEKNEVSENKDDKGQTFTITNKENPDEASLIDYEIKCATSTKWAPTDDHDKFETAINANVESLESNVMSTEKNKQKQPTNQKRSRRAPGENNDTTTVPNEVDKLRSEKGWIEFFSFERTRRKSNLLASKKISETFHLISEEMDDYTGYKEKSKKSNENKKKSDVTSNIPTKESETMINEETTAAHIPVTCEDTNFGEKSIASKIDFVTLEANEPDDVQKKDDSDLDSLAAQAIMDSEEVRNLENDLFSGLREAAKANAARNCFMSYQSTSVENTIAKNDDQNDPVSVSRESVEDSRSVEHISNNTKKSNKDAKVKPPGYKAKMYPDIEEFDMFEDKFDKIKRKRRSQAVAAKQQVTVETSTSSKSRKQSERKKIAKTSKKSHQSGLVPTKGALKGFECIKISIPTQDLQLHANVSPPRQSRKRRKTTKRRKEPSYSESSDSDFDGGDKQLSVRDIYEFKDGEDADLFELRPSTVMDRFRSINSKSKPKPREKEKNKDRVKSRDKHRRKKNLNARSKKTGENTKNMNKSSAEDHCLTETGDRSESEKNVKSEGKLSTLSKADSVIPPLIPSDTEEYFGITKTGNPCVKLRINDEASSEKGSGNAVAGTSLMSLDEDNRVRREKYKRKIEFTSLDSKTESKKTCVKDNKISARDPRFTEKCDRSGTGHTEKNVEPEVSNLNATVKDMFEFLIPSDDENNCGTKKGNQCEKSRNDDDVVKDAEDAIPGPSGFVPDRIDESDYESEMSSPEGDFIFYTSNDINCACPSENETDDSDTERGCGRLNCLNKNRNADKNTAIGNIFKNNAVRCEKPEVKDHNMKPDLDQLFDSLLETEKKPNDTGVTDLSEAAPSAEFSVRDKTPNLPEKDHDVVKSNKEDQKKNDIVSNVDESFKTKTSHPAHLTRRHESKHRNQNANKPSTSGYVSPLCLLESDLPQYLSDVEKAQENATRKISLEEYPQGNITDITVDSSLKTVEKHSKTNIKYGEDYYDLAALEEFPLPGETASTCAHLDSKMDKSDAESGNESAPTKYLKGLTPSETANMEMYTAQGSTGSSKHCIASSKDEGKLDERIVSRRRSPLLKYDIRDIESNKSTPTEMETKDKSDKSVMYEFRSESPALESGDERGVACQRARRKCTVGKQNVLAEHWSSESEVEGSRAHTSASTVAGAPHKKRRRKRDERHAHTKRREGGKGRPRGPKIRARAPRHCWSSEEEAEAGPPPQHGWIVGDSHKKLVTMLAHAKGRKRTHADRRAE